MNDILAATRTNDSPNQGSILSGLEDRLEERG